VWLARGPGRQCFLGSLPLIKYLPELPSFDRFVFMRERLIEVLYLTVSSLGTGENSEGEVDSPRGPTVFSLTQKTPYCAVLNLSVMTWRIFLISRGYGFALKPETPEQVMQWHTHRRKTRYDLSEARIVASKCHARPPMSRVSFCDCRCG